MDDDDGNATAELVDNLLDMNPPEDAPAAMVGESTLPFSPVLGRTTVPK